MSKVEVRIVELKAMRVASVHGFGPSPEAVAGEKLMAWAKPKGLVADGTPFRIFGFNNPNPSAGSPNYGYEFWIEVGEDVEPEGDVRIEAFSGGLYAVARCQGVAQIGPTWQELVEWQTTSPYSHGSHQWLEAHLSAMDTPPEEMILDLYAPITA